MRAPALLALSLTFLTLSPARAQSPFPYSARTRSYNGWNTAIQGDVNMLGMAGATIAIPRSISAAEFNPASFAMTLESIKASLNSNTIRDDHIHAKNKYDTSQWGLGISPSPWGFGFTFFTPSAEVGTYTSPNTLNTVEAEVRVRQYRLSIARMFGKKLSLGLSVGISQMSQTLGDMNVKTAAPAVRFGALYKLQNLWIIGASLSPRIDIGPPNDPPYQQDMPGFFNSVMVPVVGSAGVGWVPNQFFRAGFGLTVVGKSRNAALLGDENALIGEHITFQPSLGASYVIQEHRFLRTEVSAGTYFETSRISGRSSRLHGTFGIDLTPWFLTTGLAFDLSAGYSNVLFVVGIDVIRTLRTFDLVPQPALKPYNGFFPKPTEVSADGLPAGLAKGEKQTVPSENLGSVKELIKEIPARLEKKLDGKDSATIQKEINQEKRDGTLGEKKSKTKAKTKPKKARPKKRTSR